MRSILSISESIKKNTKVLWVAATIWGIHKKSYSREVSILLNIMILTISWKKSIVVLHILNAFIRAKHIMLHSIPMTAVMVPIIPPAVPVSSAPLDIFLSPFIQFFYFYILLPILS
jgi:hypothetical protein